MKRTARCFGTAVRVCAWCGIGMMLSARLYAASGWPGWRGSTENQYADLPTVLPADAKPVWRQSLSGPAYSGLAVGEGLLVVADHDKDKQDQIRVFEAATGKPLWTHTYDNVGPMDYGASPRATPRFDLVTRTIYTLGSRGQLYALDISGHVLWQKNLVKDFGGALPEWGFCSSLLLVQGKLIVNPGAAQASVVALDPANGKPVWA
jgi:outer membrane protein assembly factor BamB